jgi:hypothetical protein
MSMLTKSHLVPNVKLPSFVMKWNPFGTKTIKVKTLTQTKDEPSFSEQLEFEEFNQQQQVEIKSSCNY